LAPVRSPSREKYVGVASGADDLVDASARRGVERSYTLTRCASRSLRERVRSVDIDTITFASGSWNCRTTKSALEGAEAISGRWYRNRDEVPDRGPHDAVGRIVDNLTCPTRAEAMPTR
jgi:hypothetical protein